MIEKWKSTRIGCYVRLVSCAVLILSPSILLISCGTALYPNSRGYSYDADKANASADANPNKGPTPYGSKTPETSTDSTKGSTSKTPSTSSGNSSKTPTSTDDDEGDDSGDVDDETAETGDEEGDTVKTPIPPVTPTPALDGLALYTKKCGACHGALASSNVNGRTAVAIKAAITRVAVMSGVKASDDELSAIEKAFKK